MIGIYKITSPSNKIYIGQSVDIKKRWNHYFSLNCKGQTILYNSLNKHGVENHIFEIIEECEEFELNERERYWQDFYNVLGEFGMNCFLTETSVESRKISDKTRLKMSKSAKKKIITEEHRNKLSENKSGENNGMFGKTHSEKTREKMRLLKINKKLSKEHIQNKIKSQCTPVICTETNKIWDSVAECGRENKIPYTTLLNYLKNIRPNKTTFIWQTT